MKREVDLNEISDGKLYEEEELVKADCNGCKDCNQCCTGMGNTIILDPYDVYRLQVGTGMTLTDLVNENRVELQVVDGLILPNLKMRGEDERCSFLGEDGWCTIHEHRPGICRLFPLGRIYEEGDYKYFLQVNECPVKNKSKVKPSKWLETPEMGKYHRYIVKWHDIRMELEEMIATMDLDLHKKLTIMLLNNFYLMPFENEKSFYEQMDERIEIWNLQREQAVKV